MLDTIAAKTEPHEVFVVVSGGEPLMRADLEECGKGIYVRGFPWGMVTNGFALTPARYSRLLQSGLHSMTISLDGLQENHNWMRGRESSFGKASRAIKMVVDSDAVAFDVVTCVNRRNLSELPAIKELLIAPGLKECRLFSIFPQGRAEPSPQILNNFYLYKIELSEDEKNDVVAVPVERLVVRGTGPFGTRKLVG